MLRKNVNKTIKRFDIISNENPKLILRTIYVWTVIF